MSATHPSTRETAAVDPAAAEPVTAVASEANADPIRPPGTDSLTLESRPEINPAVDNTTSAGNTNLPVAPKEEKISKKEVLIEAQPINEGVLAYKAPGLVK